MVLCGMRKTCREERRHVGLARPVSAAQSPAPQDDPSGPGSSGRQARVRPTAPAHRPRAMYQSLSHKLQVLRVCVCVLRVP